MVGRYSDRSLLQHCAVGGVEPVERAVLSDRPHQASGNDRWPAAFPAVPQKAEGGRGRSDLQGDRSAQAGQEDGRSHDRGPAVHILVAHMTEGGLLTTDPPEVTSVEKVRDARLAGRHHTSVGQQRGLHGDVEVMGVVGGPGAGGEVLQKLESGRQLENRVTEVVRVPGRGERAVARGDPEVPTAVDGWSSAAHQTAPWLSPGAASTAKSN